MRPISRALTLLWVGLLSLGPATQARATTVEAMTLEQMAQRAPVIFTGRVVGARADWNASRTRIYTYVTFAVDRYLKGGSGSELLTLRIWGGQVGPYRLLVPGAPQFGINEEVLVFTGGSGAQIPGVLGLSLGKFTLTTDGVGERILKRDISGLVLVDHRTDSRRVGDPVTRYPLSEVEERIQAALH